VGKRAARRATTNPRKKGDQLAGGRTQLFSRDELKEALEKAYGNVTLVAAHLKVSRPAIYDYLDRYPELKEIRARTRRDFGDLCYAQLLLAVQRGEPWAVQEGIRRFGRFSDPELAENAPPGVGVTNVVRIEFADADPSQFAKLIPELANIENE
jgi:hypothetical protein